MSRKTWNREQFEQAAKNSYSIAGLLRQLGLAIFGSNYEMAKRYIKEFNVDISHFTGKGYLKGKKHNWSKVRELKEILQIGTYYSSHKLKKRLLKAGILINNCSICLISNWLDKPLSLHLDHINGDHTDNRLENLRLLCPNCHSQTDTYCKRKSIL